MRACCESLADKLATVAEHRVLLEELGVGGRGTEVAEEFPEEERETRDAEDEESLPHKLHRQQEVAIWGERRNTTTRTSSHLWKLIARCADCHGIYWSRSTVWFILK